MYTDRYLYIMYISLLYSYITLEIYTYNLRFFRHRRSREIFRSALFCFASRMLSQQTNENRICWNPFSFFNLEALDPAIFRRFTQ